MSLLMKALEKAAKDREEADAGRDAAAPDAAAGPPAPPPPPAARPATAAAPATPSRESMLAATVIRASERDTGGGLGNAAAYLRDHPLLVFGPIAALFLIGYGTYIYLQMTNPSMFAKQAPRPASPPPAVPAALAPPS